jgi:hypothetical protein
MYLNSSFIHLRKGSDFRSSSWSPHLAFCSTSYFINCRYRALPHHAHIYKDRAGSNRPSGTSYWAQFPIHFAFAKAVSRVPYFIHWQQLDSTDRHPLLVARYRSDLSEVATSNREWLEIHWPVVHTAATATATVRATRVWFWHSNEVILSHPSVTGPEFPQMVKTNKPLAVYSA